MSTALRPVLRPSHLPSLPTNTSKTTYVCQSCRHARLLRRPHRPYTFTQLVTLSDGSAITLRTTSPYPVYRSTRDTRNAPLWNPSSKELTTVEDDEAGRLARFRERFGRSFDTRREADEEDDAAAEGEEVTAKPEVVSPPLAEGIAEISSEGLQKRSSKKARSEQAGAQMLEDMSTQGRATRKEQQADVGMKNEEIDDGWDFGEDDANMLDLISSYGQEKIKPPAPVIKKKGKK